MIDVNDWCFAPRSMSSVNLQHNKCEHSVGDEAPPMPKSIFFI